MKHKFFCGIDVAKDTLAVALISRDNTKLHQNLTVNNDPKGFKELIKFVTSKSKNIKNVIFLLEFTGIYAMDLWKFLSDKQLNVWIEDPKRIKRSIRIQSVKTDKVDAYQLALYAYRFEDEFRVIKFPSEQWITLQELHRTRKHLVKQKASLERMLKTYKSDNEIIAEVKNKLEIILKGLKQQIRDIEKKEKQLIRETDLFKEQYENLTSIPGIKHVNATNFLLLLLSFREFDSPQKLGAYLGVVPTQYFSGTSVRRRDHRYWNANKQMQGDLIQAAQTAMRFNPDIRQYAEKRLAQGKDKNIVTKIAAYKLVKIIWALMRDNRKFEPNYKPNWKNKNAA